MTTIPAVSTQPSTANPTQSDCFLRSTEVQARTRIGKTKRGELMRRGEFPLPVKVCGGRTNYWLASEIDKWLATQVFQHRAQLAAPLSDPLMGWLNPAVKRIEQASQSTES